MSIVNTLALKSNRQIKINFDGGDLSIVVLLTKDHLFHQKLHFFIRRVKLFCYGFQLLLLL